MCIPPDSKDIDIVLARAMWTAFQFLTPLAINAIALGFTLAWIDTAIFQAMKSDLVGSFAQCPRLLALWFFLFKVYLSQVFCLVHKACGAKKTWKFI
jgi:hypothetical protein